MIGLVLAAAGTGSRFGSETPKQFVSYQGKSLYIHALDRFYRLVDEIVIVLPEGWRDYVANQIQELSYKEKLILQTGGVRRQESVHCGVLRLSENIRTVLVHDAVRPFVSPKLIYQVIQGVKSHRVCVPVFPIADTVKEIHGDRVVQTMDRQQLRLSQTPQGFEAVLLKKALQKAVADRFYGTDESSLVERLGVGVRIIPGERCNIKVTWEEDLV